MRLRLSIVLILVCSVLAPAASMAAPPKTQVSVREACASQVVEDGGVVLTTNLTMTNARSGRMVTVRVLAGWNVGRLYPKARSPLVVRLGPGETVKRTVTLRLASASELAKSLRAQKRLVCASTKTYTIA